MRAPGCAALALLLDHKVAWSPLSPEGLPTCRSSLPVLTGLTPERVHAAPRVLRWWARLHREESPHVPCFEQLKTIDWRAWLTLAWVVWFGLLYGRMVIEQRAG